MSATGTAPKKPARKKARDPWYDNAKFILVALVVVGHAWTLAPMSVREWPYNFLYLWHVPAFVMITGYLSRSFEYTRDRFWSLYKTVVVPYVLFEGLLALFRIYVGGEDLRNLWANPHWPMWYLSALFFWRLLTPILKRLRWRVLVAIIVSIGAGARATDFLDIARVLGLLPFFALGLRLRPYHFEALRTRRARAVGIAVMVALAGFARFSDRFFATEWLYYRSRYSDFESSDLQAALIRAAVIALGMAGSFAFFTLVPSRRTWFTTLGSASLVVYLFHGFPIKAAEYAGFTDWTDQHGVLAMLILTPLALAWATFLSWRPVSTVLSRMIDPISYLQDRQRHRTENRLRRRAESGPR